MIITFAFQISLIFASELDYIFQPENIFKYALYLQQTGDFYNSITEFKRFIFLYPENEKKSLAYLKIAENYFLGKDYLNCIEKVQDFISSNEKSDLYFQFLYLLGNCYLNIKNYNESISIYGDIINFSSDENLKQKSRLKIFLAHILLKEYDKAEELLTISQSNYFKPERNFLLESKNLKLDSPVFPAILSAIIPGAGEIYQGKIKEGLITFAGNLAIIFLTYYAFSTKQYIAGFYVSSIAISWYSYNIIKTINGVKESNQKKEAELTNKIIEYSNSIDKLRK